MNGPYAEHIRRLVDTAPPFSQEQRSRLATILRPVAITRPTRSGSLSEKGAAA